jgi:soluble lytic murein transglycosylase-like protein
MSHQLIASWVLVAMPAMSLLSMPCAADIWGYVDENGTAHLSDHQVNSRYLLFRKEAPRPAAEVFAPPPIVVEKPPAPPPTVSNARVIPVSPAVRAQFASMIAKVAREHKLEPSLLHAIVTVESGFDPQAKSPAGAIGLMQLMPDTASRFGVKDIWDPLENLQGGARYLRYLMKLFKDDMDLVLAAYNAGEGAVMQAGNKIPNYAETRAYVPSVLMQYEHHKGGPGGSGTTATGGASAAGTTPVPSNRDKPVMIR